MIIKGMCLFIATLIVTKNIYCHTKTFFTSLASSLLHLNPFHQVCAKKHTVMAVQFPLPIFASYSLHFGKVPGTGEVS
jgi:hypothetical protein